MKRILTVMAAAVSLAGAGVAAQQTQGTAGMKERLEAVSPDAVFASWDKDNNERLTKQEFMAGLGAQNWFQHVDKDGNDRISKAEFQSQLKAMNVYRKADTDNDGMVEAQEIEPFLGTQQAAKWNKRQPASLSEDELYDGVYSAWTKDASAGLTEEELVAGVFNLADRDDNGSISKDEFAKDIARIKPEKASRTGMPGQGGMDSARMQSQQPAPNPAGANRSRGDEDEAVGTSGAVTAVTVEDIVDNPDAYIGATVRVSGEVGDVFGARVFNIEERGVIDVDDELIVVAPKNSPAITDDANVQVRGKVRRIVSRDLEVDYGPTYWTYWGVDRDFFVTRESRPVLFAESIDVRR